MAVDIKEFLSRSQIAQRQYISSTLCRLPCCIIYNAAVKNNTTQHVPELRQLRNLIDVKTAIDYHNRSEPVVQRINARPDSDVIWSGIYNQYIPAIAALANAGDVTGAWAAIMAMLAEVESQY